MPHARKSGTAWDRRKEDYAHTRELDSTGWAWEFLRRNEVYRRDYRMKRAGHPVAIPHISGATLYRPRRRFLAAEAWGLELFANPDKSALVTDVFWLSHLKSHAVQCHSRPADADALDALSLDMFPGRRGILIDAQCEHIVVCGRNCGASMVVGSGTMLFGKSNVAFTHIGLKAAQRHYETAQILSRIISSKANNNVGVAQKDSKYLDYLIALDGRLVGRSYREIADVLYGRDRVGAYWSDDTRGLKSRVIRAAKCGFALMDRGYFKLL